MDEKFKIVVVTGCLGLIGSHVTRECLAQGWKVYGIDKCTYAANTEYIEEFNKNKEEDNVDVDIDLKNDYLLNEGVLILSDYLYLNTNLLLSEAA